MLYRVIIPRLTFHSGQTISDKECFPKQYTTGKAL